MPKYVVELDVLGAGELKGDELKAISQRSCGVLIQMGSQIPRVERFVTAGKIDCIYTASNETIVREHAERGAFPRTASPKSSR